MKVRVNSGVWRWQSHRLHSTRGPENPRETRSGAEPGRETEKPAPWLIFRNPKTRSRPWISLREARSVAGHRCRVVIWTMEVASSSNRGVFWFHASRQGVRIAEMR